MTEVNAQVKLTSYSHGAGCACKMGLADLGEVLGLLGPPDAAADVLVGLGEADDAAVLRISDDDALVLDGLRAGARGYLLKDVSLEQLTLAIKTLAAGGTLVQPAVTERILKGLAGVPRGYPSLPTPDPLTGREREVVRLMAGGYSNREIALALGMSEGTVKNHVSSVLSKLGVRDRTRAVLKALELGYV